MPLIDAGKLFVFHLFRYSITAWMIFTIGCSNAETRVEKPAVASENVPLKPTSNRSELGTLTSSTGLLTSAEDRMSESQTNNLLQQWRAPLRGDEVFFSPPKTEKVETDTASPQIEISVNKESIRLLGFVQVDEGTPSTTQAILRIDDRMVYCKAGDTIDEVEIVEIAPPRVTVQSHRQRWDIGLFEQPAMKQGNKFTSIRSAGSNAVSQPVPSRRTISRIQPTTRNQLSTSAKTPATSHVADIPSPEPADDIQPPIIPDLPEPPEFPELEDQP